jgi:hypothetical protein
VLGGLFGDGLPVALGSFSVAVDALVEPAVEPLAFVVLADDVFAFAVVFFATGFFVTVFFVVFAMIIFSSLFFVNVCLYKHYM